MSRRFPCCVPGCRVCRPTLPIDRWREEGNRTERSFDPDFKLRKQVRRAKAFRQSNERRLRLVEEAERAARR